MLAESKVSDYTKQKKNIGVVRKISGLLIFMREDNK